MGDFTNGLWVRKWIVDKPGWESQGSKVDGRMYVRRDGSLPRDQILVIVSGARELDDKRWVHVSVSRGGEIPSYDDLVLVKATFIGAERKAIFVIPPQSEHVNIHSNCLHIWHCVDGDGLPDFTRGTGSL